MSAAINMKPLGGDSQKAGLPHRPVQQEIPLVSGHQWALPRLTADLEVEVIRHTPLLQGDRTTMSTAINMKPLGGDSQEAGLPHRPVKQEIWEVPGCWRDLLRLTADLRVRVVRHTPLLQGDRTAMRTAIDIKLPQGDSQKAGLPGGPVKQEI